MSVPHDTWAERALVGGLLAAEQLPPDVEVRREDIYDPQLREVLAAVLVLADNGRPCDPVAVRAELMRAGHRGQTIDGAWLADLMSSGGMLGSLGHYAKTLRSLSVRREVLALAQRAVQDVMNPQVEPQDVAAELYAAALVLSESGDPIRPPDLIDANEFLAGDDSYDWLIPGLLERGDRLLLTGGEGSGKSVLSRMLAVTAAVGVHPINGTRFDPLRVLLVDLENGTRHLRRELRKLADHAHAIGRPLATGQLTVESRPSGIDLTGIEDRIWLTRLCDAVRPEVLVIGPLYRMHAADMNAEEPARALTRTIDDIRAAHNCAIVMETHAPHGQQGQTRNLRPVGSSLFRRWPEFGYGLRPKDSDGAVMNLVAWRGPRDEREFPPMLARGGPQEWPWAPFHGLRIADSWGGE